MEAMLGWVFAEHRPSRLHLYQSSYRSNSAVSESAALSDNITIPSSKHYPPSAADSSKNEEAAAPLLLMQLNSQSLGLQLHFSFDGHWLGALLMRFLQGVLLTGSFILKYAAGELEDAAPRTAGVNIEIERDTQPGAEPSFAGSPENSSRSAEQISSTDLLH